MRSQYLTFVVQLSVLLCLHVIKLSEATTFLPQRASVVSRIRGGSTRVISDDSDENHDEQEEDPEILKKRQALRKYRMDQQMLMQLRSTILSEALAKRGLPMTTLVDVSTADGDKPPEKVDWDCALSTEDEPKTCLYSFDAEPNTKVIAPLGTTQWISLSALNRLRRTDPTKVEPMWHSQYAILRSWFGDDSEYSVLQHAGPRGLGLSLLLDHSVVLKGLLTTVFLVTVILFLPLLDFWMNRMLVSSTIWMNWPQWARIVHAALPLKLLLGQMGWKALAKMFGKIERRVKDILVEMECSTLEATIPLTVGPGSEVTVDPEDEFDFEIVLNGDDEDTQDVEDEYNYSDSDN